MKTLLAMLEPDPDQRASSVEEAMQRGAWPEPAPRGVVAWLGLLIARLYAMWRSFRTRRGQAATMGNVQYARIRPSPGEEVLRAVRSVTPEQAQAEAMRSAARGEAPDEEEDAEEWADRRAKEEADRWEPPEAWVTAEAAQEERRRRRAKR